MTIITILVLAILMILLANSLFLESYYTSQNKSLFYKEYEKLKYEFTRTDKDFLELLREEDRKTGFLFYIAAIDGMHLRRTDMTSVPFISPPGANHLGQGIPLNLEIPREHMDYIRSKIDSLQRGEVVYDKIQREHKVNMEFDLVFAGLLDNQNLLIIVRPVEQLNEHTAISNQFLLIIGMISLLISIIIAYRTAKSIVKPIREITDIGGHIANLDFSHRYTGSDRDEIGILGDSINRISEQLDKAIKDLQTEMSLQKRFFAGVSHEFKTPVGLIRGYAESLRLGLASSHDDVIEFSDIILDETDRLNHLVSDIMFLVKSESVEFILNVERIELISILNNSLNKNMTSVLNKEIKLERNFPPTACIEGDEIRIKQIFENFLSNAIRHTPEGGRIFSSAYFDEDGIRVAIRNEGELIPDEHINNLFEAFYSVFESRNKSSSGTGLGLSIVKNLVEKHKGKYGIDNIHQEGFLGVEAWFWLPLN